MQELELRLPPVAVVLLHGVVAWWLAQCAFLPMNLGGMLALAVPLLLVTLALALGLTAVVGFRRRRTTVNPTRPGEASQLVTAGVYRFSRNPMYLALLLCLCAWVLALADGLALIAVPLFVLYMNRFQIVPEERAMERLFGDEYRHYCRRVRRWL
ncbi:Protein-S-isoprenylcysteine O-methyltransferase Ste14 [Ferrimonas sediminum]|uniref:Protein-S-isoprenylcysteine O-methyltransferase Ste14 n=1 Tax=Ferrimonas sediminum TaxID=718193 RepID=A0A1G8VJS8_9GAMM|nr:isoprenylcysteine carboxylmethyltransferase family protein [Ferrimonas sediminum]SDJ66366.1 Protein-S-isoprenylcysteine O-methyltransferase Ste14 [Ferrimonas sediminum]